MHYPTPRGRRDEPTRATPKQPIAPFVKDYLAMVLFGEGQAIIARFVDSADGFLPLSQHDLGLERKKLED